MNNNMNIEEKCLSSLDDILTPKELMKVLKIGRNQCYKLLKSRTIKSIKIGTSYRIPKMNVINYIQNQ